MGSQLRRISREDSGAVRQGGTMTSSERGLTALGSLVRVDRSVSVSAPEAEAEGAVQEEEAARRAAPPGSGEVV